MFSIFSNPAAIGTSTVAADNLFHFPLRESNLSGSIELVQNPDDIDPVTSRNVLVEAFIAEYQQYLSPEEISGELTSWRNGWNCPC